MPKPRTKTKPARTAAARTPSRKPAAVAGTTTRARGYFDSLGLRAAYDAAASGLRLVDYTNASDAGINEALWSELSTIRRRARFEIRNNGLAKGLGRTYANVAVGKGPRLNVTCKDEAWGQLVETEFTRWSGSCEYRRGRSLAQLMHLVFKQFFPCGEAFIVPRIDRSAPSSDVQLRFLMIRPDRVDSPMGAGFNMGVETDEDGRPKIYHVLKQDTDNYGNPASLYETAFDQVAADKMLHVFVEEDPAQLRGEPWLAQALNVFHKIRRLDESILTAAELGAMFSSFLVATMPEMLQDADILLPDTMDIDPGTLTTLPPGYEPKQLKPEQPSTNVAEFRRDQLAAAGKGSSMPVNAVTGDSSKHNFASARFDGLLLTSDVDVVRGEVVTQVLDKMFNMWLGEAWRVGRVPFPTEAYTLAWLWPRNEPHTDPLKGANAEKTRLQNGTKTVGDVVLEDGRDDKDHRKRLLDEVSWYRENGLAHPIDAAAKSVDQDKVEEKDLEDEEDENGEPKEKGK